MQLLGIGAWLDPAFISEPHWTVIRGWFRERKWLRSTATSADALHVLADAGIAETTLESPDR